MHHRQERLNSLIREELSKIISRELEFNGLVTITAVEVAEKFEDAKVLVSILPASEEKTSLKILNGQAGELRHLLLKKMNIRSVPRLVFKIDKGPEKAARVEKILLDDNIE